MVQRIASWAVGLPGQLLLAGSHAGLDLGGLLLLARCFRHDVGSHDCGGAGQCSGMPCLVASPALKGTACQRGLRRQWPDSTPNAKWTQTRHASKLPPISWPGRAEECEAAQVGAGRETAACGTLLWPRERPFAICLHISPVVVRRRHVARGMERMVGRVSSVSSVSSVFLYQVSILANTGSSEARRTHISHRERFPRTEGSRTRPPAARTAALSLSSASIDNPQH